MTVHERFLRMFQHRDADRVPIIDSAWAGTVRRWQNEGMPKDVSWQDFFGVDKVAGISVNITPRFETKLIEDTPRYYIATSEWGVTMKHFKELDSTPEFLDFTVVNAEEWEKAKKRMTVSDDRIPWDWLKQNYDRVRAEGQWVRANFWFGFDVTHSWMMGTQNLLVAMIEEPELITDMFDTYLNSCIALFDRIWDAGYRFDEIYWPDDMGYKGTTFFSPQMYRTLLKPYHTKAVKWAHDKGIYAHLHSCGNIMQLLPDVIETGVDALNPLEIKAGMDPLYIKEKWGDRLTLHGGINAVLWDQTDKIISEIDRLVPKLKENGGYIFSSDHSIPNNVTLENFRAIVEEAKRAGSY